MIMIMIIMDSITNTIKDNHLVFELKQKHFDIVFLVMCYIIKK